MANMSYCRFQNTLEDLLDCQDALDEDDLSESERKARERLIEVCAEIAERYADHGESAEDIDDSRQIA